MKIEKELNAEMLKNAKTFKRIYGGDYAIILIKFNSKKLWKKLAFFYCSDYTCSLLTPDIQDLVRGDYEKMFKDSEFILKHNVKRESRKRDRNLNLKLIN